MVPADKIVTCTEWDPISTVIDGVIDNNISAVVVLNEENEPSGIVTKTDLVSAYKQGIPLAQKVGVIMATNLITLPHTTNRDDAAKLFEQNLNHHAIIVNERNKFVGVISTWDIAAECAKDSRAWPWTRSADGKIHESAPVH